jgi:hypothetical protein
MPFKATKHVLGILVVVTTVVAAQSDLTRTFEDDRIGSPPKGFLFPVTREAAPDKWLVQREGLPKVGNTRLLAVLCRSLTMLKPGQATCDNALLAHLGDPSGGSGFALAVLDGPHYGDVTVTARLKLVGGDRAGGVVWRFQDSRNYYMARVDLRKQEIGLFRVVDGNRIRIERDDDLELDPNAWHALKIVQEDEKVKVYLNGIRVLQARDRTFPSAGGVGLWSAEASVVYFDDLRAKEQDE